MSNGPRILIVRLTAIGDVMHGLPVLNALRDRFPQAELAWIVEGGTAHLLEGHPALDRLIAVPRRWLKSLPRSTAPAANCGNSPRRSPSTFRA